MRQRLGWRRRSSMRSSGSRDGWRPLSVGRSGRLLIGCGQWLERAEAVERLRALWEAWKAARAEGGNAMSYWWTVHVDAHWAALTDSATGPFSACAREGPAQYRPPGTSERLRRG